jgi:hypothetical protein
MSKEYQGYGLELHELKKLKKYISAIDSYIQRRTDYVNGKIIQGKKNELKNKEQNPPS